MSNLLLIGGAFLLVGGLAGVWASAQSYRRGDPWRGGGLAAVASTMYGGLTLTGVVFNGTAVGAVIVWTIAAATWAALWIGRRERMRPTR